MAGCTGDDNGGLGGTGFDIVVVENVFEDVAVEISHSVDRTTGQSFTMEFSIENNTDEDQRVFISYEVYDDEGFELHTGRVIGIGNVEANTGVRETGAVLADSAEVDRIELFYEDSRF